MLLALWRRTQRGILPYSGGWLEQPVQLTDIFAALDNEEILLKESHGDN